jgi:hypothetical protein
MVLVGEVRRTKELSAKTAEAISYVPELDNEAVQAFNR